MSRLAERFARLRAAGRKALIPYVTAGDPAPAITVPLMQAMAAAGADVIELGVPFSDPMADGPVIQRASERALRHHVSLHKVLDMVREFRRGDAETPVVLMGYLNPVEAMGYAAFAAAAAAAGVDGALTVDLPPEEAGDLLTALKAHDLDPIFLIAPNTTAERLRAISAAARGFIYYVSLKGVTGAAHLDVESVRSKVAEIRRATDLPVGVGFGIRDAAAAAAVADVADAVVVGSALVKIIEEAGNDTAAVIARVSARLTEMRRAIDTRGRG
jgi:tryptophan synthase alpha chain